MRGLLFLGKPGAVFCTCLRSLPLGFFRTAISAGSTGWTLMYSLYLGADFHHLKAQGSPVPSYACGNLVGTVTASLSCRLWQILLPAAETGGLGIPHSEHLFESMFCHIVSTAPTVSRASFSLNLWIDFETGSDCIVLPGLGLAMQTKFACFCLLSATIKSCASTLG